MRGCARCAAPRFYALAITVSASLSKGLRVVGRIGHRRTVAHAREWNCSLFRQAVRQDRIGAGCLGLLAFRRRETRQPLHGFAHRSTERTSVHVTGHCDGRVAHQVFRRTHVYAGIVTPRRTACLRSCSITDNDSSLGRSAPRSHRDTVILSTPIRSANSFPKYRGRSLRYASLESAQIEPSYSRFGRTHPRLRVRHSNRLSFHRLPWSRSRGDPKRQCPLIPMG